MHALRHFVWFAIITFNKQLLYFLPFHKLHPYPIHAFTSRSKNYLKIFEFTKKEKHDA